MYGFPGSRRFIACSAGKWAPGHALNRAILVTSSAFNGWLPFVAHDKKIAFLQCEILESTHSSRAGLAFRSSSLSRHAPGGSASPKVCYAVSETDASFPNKSARASPYWDPVRRLPTSVSTSAHALTREEARNAKRRATWESVRRVDRGRRIRFSVVPFSLTGRA